MSEAANGARANPYVGPRAFTREEQLWGRDREITELVDLLIAERIVLLFSPSGAGKSSLLEAGVRKALEAERFHVLPTVRVSAPPRATVAAATGETDAGATRATDATSTTGVNPYIASVLLFLERGLPGGGEPLFDEQAQVNLGVLDRLTTADERGPLPTVLIFDQFEEILTLNPADQPRKEAFFAEIGRVLRDRNRWAIFAMREEYVAALDPYVRPVPTRLATRYRLDLLGPAAAMEAIRQPALARGVDFTERAAAVVVDDLRRIKVPRPGGGTEEALGPHVEPVQLQVVCRRLWSALPAGAASIDVDRTTPGDAQQALTAYYDDTLDDVSASSSTSERRLRDWFGRELMTSQGLRTQVAHDAEETIAVQAAIPELLAAHLIRSEARRGGTWYELAHDRLVAPVRESNDRWYREHAHGVERQAALWDQSGRRPALLLPERDLHEAEGWARAHPERASDRINAYLNESRRAVLAQATRRTRLLATVAVGAALVLFVAAGLLLFAVNRARALQTAERQLQEARTEREKVSAENATLEDTVKSAGQLVQSRYTEAPEAQVGAPRDPSTAAPPPPPDQRPTEAAPGTGVSTSAPPVPSSGAPPAAPLKVDPTVSLNAAIALDRVLKQSSAATIERTTPRASITYYTRERDTSRLVDELSRLGFDFSTQPSARSSRASNCVWYGQKVALDDVKVVALALLRAGVGLQMIKPFDNSANKESLIEIGNMGGVATPVLAVGDLDRLSPDTPVISASSLATPVSSRPLLSPRDRVDRASPARKP